MKNICFILLYCFLFIQAALSNTDTLRSISQFPKAHNKSILPLSSGLCIYDNHVIRYGNYRYSSQDKIVSVFPMIGESVGIIVHKEKYNYRFIHLGGTFNIISVIDFSVVRDLGFPQIETRIGGDYLFLNPVEQVVTIYSSDGKNYSSVPLFDSKDFDHEKRLIFVDHYKNQVDLLLGQETAIGDKNDVSIIGLTSNGKQDFSIPVHLSLPYHAAMSNNIVGIVGTSFTQNYERAEHKLILMDLTSPKTTRDWTWSTIPHFFKAHQHQFYAVFKDRVFVVSDNGLGSTQYTFEEEITPLAFILTKSSNFILGGLDADVTGGLSFKKCVLIQYHGGKATEYTVDVEEPFYHAGFIQDKGRFYLDQKDNIILFDLP